MTSDVPLSQEQREAILDLAIARYTAVGWLLTGRIGFSAELTSPYGPERLNLEVQPDGQLTTYSGFPPGSNALSPGTIAGGTPSIEQGIAEVPGFGTITDQRLMLQRRTSLFGGTSVEDIPLRHVTSVRLEIARHPIWGILLVLIGFAFLSSQGGGSVVGVILLVWAALLLWGSPKVVVNTAGGDLRPIPSFPWNRADAERFVGALRSQLFRGIS